MTIVEAIRMVLAAREIPITAREAYAAIIKANLYTFHSNNPIAVVSNQIRRHCKGLDFPSASKTKYFELADNGRYALLKAPVKGHSNRSQVTTISISRPISITRKIREQVLKRFNYQCAICGRKGRYHHFDIEHIVPFAQGGTASIDNLQVLCRSCNVLKHKLPLHESRLKEIASASYRLERSAAEILHNMDFTVLSGATGPDGGVDLIAKSFDKRLKRDVTLLIECKWLSGKMDNNVVTQFASKLEHFMADFGVIITNVSPTASATRDARSFGISILSISQLPNYIAQFSGGSNERL